MLKKIDGWLIDKIFQPISNKLQRLTGRDCFSLAKAILILIFPLLAIGTALSSAHLSIYLMLGLSVLGTIYLAIPKLKRKFEHTGCMNPERINGLSRFLRIINIIVTSRVSFLVATTNDREWVVVLLIGWANVASLYFLACTPLPPCKSWAGKLLEKLKAAVSGIATPAPEPVKVNYGS